MRRMINNVDDQAVERFAQAISNPKEASHLLLEDVFRSSYIVVVVMACFFISVISLISFVIAIISNAFTISKKTPNRGTMRWALLSFVFCLVTAALGTYLFDTSIGHIKHSVTSLPDQLKKSSADLSTFVEEFGENLRCNFQTGEKILRDDITMFIYEITQVLNNIRARLNPDVVHKIFIARKQLANSLNLVDSLAGRNDLRFKPLLNATEIVVVNAKRVDSMTEMLKEVYANLGLIGRDINTSISQMNLQKEAMLSELTVYRNFLDKVVKEVDQQLRHLEQTLFSAATKNDYIDTTTKYISFASALPLTLVVLSVAGLIFLSLRCLCNIGNTETNVEFPMRHRISDAGGQILSCGGYLALLVNSLLFMMVALCFIIAFASMFLCMGLFEDYDLRLLYALPRREFREKLGKQDIKFTLYDIFYKCKNGFPFFDAIDADKHWAREEIGKKLSAMRISKFRRRLRNFQVNQELIDGLNSTVVAVDQAERTITNLTDSSKGTPGFEHNRQYISTLSSLRKDVLEFSNRLRDLHELLSEMSSRSKRDKFSKDIQSHLDQAEMEIIRAVADLLRILSDLSPQCDPLMSIWDDMGSYLCNVVAVPTQGLWVACLISGIGSFSIYYALFNATRFLFNYQTEKETASSSKTQQTTKSPVDKDKRPHEAASLPPPSFKRARVEWMPVEKIKGKMWFEPRMQKNQDLRTKPVSKNSASSSLYQMEDIPSAVKHIPVFVKELGEGPDKNEEISLRKVERAIWIPSGDNLTQGMWQKLVTRGVERPITSSAATSVRQLQLSEKSKKLNTEKKSPLKTKSEYDSEMIEPQIPEGNAAPGERSKERASKVPEGPPSPMRLSLPPAHHVETSSRSKKEMKTKDKAPRASPEQSQQHPSKSDDLSQSSRKPEKAKAATESSRQTREPQKSRKEETRAMNLGSQPSTERPLDERHEGDTSKKQQPPNASVKSTRSKKSDAAKPK